MMGGTPEEKNARFAEYFKMRSLQQDNSVAMSPEQLQPKPGTAPHALDRPVPLLELLKIAAICNFSSF